jgi:2-polyprenyl-6-methoxyphenol hydroxylase-like FAD-dependent oxidoreductase
MLANRPMTNAAPPPTIAIVGGGIGGFAAAAFLHQAGFPVTVYEQAWVLRRSGLVSLSRPTPPASCAGSA